MIDGRITKQELRILHTMVACAEKEANLTIIGELTKRLLRALDESYTESDRLIEENKKLKQEAITARAFQYQRDGDPKVEVVNNG